LEHATFVEFAGIQTVLAGSNVPRVNNVNFAVSVGTVVPTSVRFVDVPSALIEVNPAWRGHPANAGASATPMTCSSVADG